MCTIYKQLQKWRSSVGKTWKFTLSAAFEGDIGPSVMNITEKNLAAVTPKCGSRLELLGSLYRFGT